MNYKALLEKYINHVIDYEGYDFLDGYTFTEEEYQELKTLAGRPDPGTVEGPVSRTEEWNKKIKELLLKDLESMKYVSIQRFQMEER